MWSKKRKISSRENLLFDDVSVLHKSVAWWVYSRKPTNQPPPHRLAKHPETSGGQQPDCRLFPEQDVHVGRSVTRRQIAQE